MTDQKTINALADAIIRQAEWRAYMQKIAEEKKYKRRLRKKTPALGGEQ